MSSSSISQKGQDLKTALRFARNAASFVLFLTAHALHAQISFSTAIDLALRNSPKVKMAEDDVAKARAAFQETRGVFIPSLVGGSGLGYSYGFPVGQPTLYNFTLQSLVFDQSQKNYIRAARLGLDAATAALAEARQAAAEDTANTYFALDYDLQRQTALTQQFTNANHLVEIVQARIGAGQDNQIDITRAQLTSARIHLASIHGQTEVNYQRIHLANLIGLPAKDLQTIHESIPAIPSLTAFTNLSESSPGIDAAYATAKSRLQTAFGDARKIYRPQIGFAAQYNRYAEFNNYQEYYSHFQRNNAAFGIQINIPIFNANIRIKARESLADALRAQHDADRAKAEFLEGRVRIQDTLPELSVRTEIASLDRQLAQQQIDALQIQLQGSSLDPNGPQMTPKDEQNARIQERQKYLDYLDADLQLHQAQISWLRSTGQLEDWIKSTVQPRTPIAASASNAVAP